MTALAAFRISRTGQAPTDRILNLADVLEFNNGVARATGVPYERLFFGMPVSRAVGSGFQITARGYFDATESPLAVHTAKRLRRLCESGPGRRPGAPRLLDLFAGTGQQTWAFVRSGFQVQSTELDPIRALVAQHNVRVSGLGGRTSLTSTNGATLLRRLVGARERFDAVYLDPPWAGRYDYDLNRPFRLEYMEPSGLDLLEQAFHLSDVVALKCPQNTSAEQLREVCLDLGVLGRFELQNLVHLPPELNQATVYFVKRQVDRLRSQCKEGRASPPIGLSIESVSLSVKGES
jgi:hypothetical protein